MKRNIVLILTVAAIVFAYTTPVLAKIIDRSDVSVDIEATDTPDLQALDTHTLTTRNYGTLWNVLAVLAGLMFICGTLGKLLPIDDPLTTRLFTYTFIIGLGLIAILFFRINFSG